MCIRDRVLVFDNYDSFTYNLVQIIEQILGEKVDVFRNDEIPLEAVSYTHLDVYKRQAIDCINT